MQQIPTLEERPPEDRTVSRIGNLGKGDILVLGCQILVIKVARVGMPCLTFSP